MSSGVRIIYRKGIRRVTLQRLIVSRIVFESEKVTFDELLVLFDNLLNIQDLAQRDENFRKKFGSSLEDLTLILKSVQINLSSIKNILKVLKRNFKAKLESFIIPQRNLFQIKKHLNESYRILPTKLPGKSRRQLPPKRFIGVGYRDKGTRRDQAKDGSPSWQEVAMSLRISEKRL